MKHKSKKTKAPMMDPRMMQQAAPGAPQMMGTGGVANPNKPATCNRAN